MSLPDFQAQIDAHLATKPIQPCPVSEMTPDQYSEWSGKFGPWAAEKEILVNLAAGIEKTQPMITTPPLLCIERADYYYRGPMPRKRSAA